MSGVIVPDASSILKLISPAYNALGTNNQTGRIAVVGVSEVDPASAYFAAISALKLGAGCSFVFCTKYAAPVIQSYSPELVVKPVLCESNGLSDVDKELLSPLIIEEVVKCVIQFDCLVIGPGLGNDQFLLYCVSEIMREARQAGIPMVVDGDGFYLVRNDVSLIRDYTSVVLPLCINEFNQLALTVLGVYFKDEDVMQQFPSLSKELGGVTILLKGKCDFITDGKQVYEVNILGSARSCYNDAHALCGSIALFVAWARLRAAKGHVPISQTLMGCIAGSTVYRHAGAFTFENKSRSTLTSDIIENLGTSLEELHPLRRESEFFL